MRAKTIHLMRGDRITYYDFDVLVKRYLDYSVYILQYNNYERAKYLQQTIFF